MNEKILNALQSATNDNRETTRRRFPRRMTDTSVVTVDGTTYPVEDWSQCGVLFDADGRDFAAGDEHAAVMKFRMSDVVTEITVKARVIRTGKRKVALEFFDMPKKAANAFAKVIDDAIAAGRKKSDPMGMA